MTKIKFVNDEGNLSSKGFTLQEVYEIGPRTESVKYPGKFYHAVSGGRVTPYNEWETTLFKFFMFQKDTEESTRAKAYLAKLKEQSLPAGTPIAPAPVQQSAPVAQTAPVQSAPVQETVIVSPNLGQELATKQPAQETPMQPSFQQRTSVVVEPKASERDILLSGLTKLDFQSLNLKLLKIEGKISLVIIVDGMPPLAINSGDVSASAVVQQIVDTFSENALIVSTIREWNKSLKELEADTEAKVKKAKEANANADKPVVATEQKPKNTRGKGTTPAVAIEPPVSDVTETEPAAFSDDLDSPADMPNEGDNEVPTDEGNGLDPEVEEYELK